MIYKVIKECIISTLGVWNHPEEIEVDDLPDYKWYCLGGEPKYSQVIQNRHSDETIDLFEKGWRYQVSIILDPIDRLNKDFFHYYNIAFLTDGK